VIPSARKSTTSLTGDALEFSFSVPKGKKVKAIHVEAELTTVGAVGAGSSYVADLIKEIEIKNEADKRVLHAHGGGGIGILALFAACLASLAGLAAQLVLNDDIVVGNATYYGNWLINHGIKGEKFSVTVTVHPISVLVYATSDPTSATFTVGVAMELGDEEPTPGLLKGYVLPSQVTFKDELISALVAIDGTDLSDRISGFSWGSKSFNTAQQKILQNMTNYRLRGAAAAGSQNPVPGVLGPVSANALYAAFLKLT
jgi:hypothetical protein